MDFRRIEQIFFITFLCLDIFLLNLFLSGKPWNGNIESDKKDAIETRLEKDHINYPTLPTTREKGVYLSGVETSFGKIIEKMKKEEAKQPLLANSINILENQYTVTLKNQYFVNPKEVEKSLKPLFSSDKEVLYGKEYRYDANFSVLNNDPTQLHYYQTYHQVPIIDDTTQITFSLEKKEQLWGVVSYKQTHLENISALREQQTLYTGKDAVITLYNNSRIPAKATIEFVQLSYTKILRVKQKNIYIPVWFVGVKINQTRNVEQVNALNNTLLNSSGNSKVGN